MKSKFIVLGLLILFLLGCRNTPVSELSLAGKWTVVLDSLDTGNKERWAAKTLEGTEIDLPGTLDDVGIGKENTQVPIIDNSVLWGLTRKHQYIGPAWYQKQFEVPSEWKNENLKLELERVIWESQVFIDGNLVGKNRSLSAPHYFDLGKVLTPGKHTLTIRIDNSNIYPLINVQSDKYPDTVNRDMAHAYTNHTQIKWNGILGDIKLVKIDSESIENLQIYSSVEEGTVQAIFQKLSSPDLDLKYQILSVSGEIMYEGSVESGKNEVTIKNADKLETWDEFNPVLYDFRIYSDKTSTSERFGFSEVKNKGKELTLNGKRIYLRGNLECSIFPLTGHPPLEKEGWAQLIAQAKAYGLNHLRFHSWCPPNAAFEAADEAGFYLQAELPHWSLRFGEDENTTKYLLEEAEAILNEYGNHPSFIMMALGNELQGDAELMNSTVADLRAKDDRRLYMTTCYSFQYPLGVVAQPEDDFFVTQKTDKGWIRGQGIFNAQAPNFDEDYTANSAHVPVPLISHEIGQYSVFPAMAEIEKYTGVLKPLNFLAVKNALEENGLLEMADDFTYASGKLAAMLYKEEIERALKTPAFDGFQLLQLQDFPGQGTALVGLLDAFWDSKGVISAEEFRQFNSEVVPLIRFEKAVYESGETFSASVEIGNFYREMKGKNVNWSVKNGVGESIEKGSLENIDLVIGNNRNLGNIEIELEANKAEKLVIEVSLEETDYKNNWSIWVYPKEVRTSSNEVVITTSMKTAEAELAKGKKVLFNPDYKKLKGITGRFVPVFWSPVHFPNQPSTMGLLLEEDHPAFQEFPTSSYTEWQWYDLCIQSKSLVIDGLDVQPIVRAIDNFVTNHHLASVFETQVGEGKLVFSAIDLVNDLSLRPVARQLRSSLIKYMEGADFNPSGKVNFNQLDFLDTAEGKKFEASDIYND